jgi:hypothetical protein
MRTVDFSCTEQEGSGNATFVVRDTTWLADALGSMLGMTVISESHDASEDPVLFRYPMSCRGNRDVELVFRSIESKTDFELTLEDRKTEILYLSRVSEGPP